MKRSTGSARVFGVLLVLSGLTAGGCSARVFVKSENPSLTTYRKVVVDGVQTFQVAGGKLHPTCDKGGDQRLCYQASLGLVSVIDTFTDSLNKATVPSGCTAAHGHLLQGLATERAGLIQRNQGLSSGSDADWSQGNQLLAQGVTQMNDALKEYPKDVGLGSP